MDNILTCESPFLRILDKYLYKELTLTFMAVLLVLLLITFGTETARLLALAVEGRIPPSVVFEVLLLKIPPALEIILPLVALLSVMLVLGRLYQDQEMVVLNACGIGRRYFQLRVLLFMLPVALLTAWVSLWLSPWSFKQERELIAQAQVNAPLAGLVAGRFNSLPSGQGVLYAEKISPQGELTSVWIQLNQAERDVILSAPRGFFEQIDGRLALVLLEGYSYEGLWRGEHLTHRRFERMDAFIPDIVADTSRPSRYEQTTLSLWHDPSAQNQALLQWRMAVPLSLILLALLAVKMSKTNPREGRFAKVFIAIVLYVVYNQLLVSSRGAVADGTLSPWLGLWWVMAVFLIYALWPQSYGKRRRFK